MRTHALLVPVLCIAISAAGCGKSSYKEFSPAGGRFSILMPGNPKQENKNIGGLNMTVYSTGWLGEENGVAYVDIPPGGGADLNAVVKGMHDGTGGEGLRCTSTVRNGEGYAEFEFESTQYKGFVSGRAVVARGRLYIMLVIGKDAHLSTPETRNFIDSFTLSDGPTPGKNEEPAPASVETPIPVSGPAQSTPSASKPSPSRVPVRPTEVNTTVFSPEPSGSSLAQANPSPARPSPISPAPPDTDAIDPPRPSDPPAATTPAPGPVPAPANPAAGAPGRQGRPNRPGQQPNAFGQQETFGFKLGTDFKDSAPEGGLLVGFDVGYGFSVNSNNDIVVALRPIYRVGDKDKPGTLIGTNMTRTTKVLAKSGYAVGAVTGKGALVVDGFYLTFMKVAGDQLDPNDYYFSPWIGGPGGNGPTTITGKGRTAIGILGKTNDKDLRALGLQFGPLPVEALPAGDKPKDLPDPPKIPTSPRFVGGWNDPEFREEEPNGGFLVGFDVGMGGLGSSIVTIRGIYQVKGKTKDVVGGMRGTKIQRAIKERARQGYAVGAITVKGALWVDGFSITYMKIVDDKLDPSDTYESNWIGNDGKANEKFLITGEGTPVVGLIGRQNRADLNALGLLFKGADGTKKLDAKKK